MVDLQLGPLAPPFAEIEASSVAELEDTLAQIGSGFGLRAAMSDRTYYAQHEPVLAKAGSITFGVTSALAAQVSRY